MRKNVERRKGLKSPKIDGSIPLGVI